MNVNPFSFLSYEELRKIVQKGDDSFLAKATLAYKNPNYQRSISSLEKLLLSFPLAIEFLYFRSLAKIHLKDNERYKDLNNPLIAHAEDLFVFFETHPSFEEILQRNLYLAFLLSYLPNYGKQELVYGYPNSIYGAGVYDYALLIKRYGLTSLRKECSKSFKKEGDVRHFFTLLERETLSLLLENPFIKEEDYLKHKNIKGRYLELRKASIKEKENILLHLQTLGLIETLSSHLNLLEGGFFLYSCFSFEK